MELTETIRNLPYPYALADNENFRRIWSLACDAAAREVEKASPSPVTLPNRDRDRQIWDAAKYHAEDLASRLDDEPAFESSIARIDSERTVASVTLPKCGAAIRYKFMGGGCRFQCESEEFASGHYSQSEACQIANLQAKLAAAEKRAEDNRLAALTILEKDGETMRGLQGKLEAIEAACSALIARIEILAMQECGKPTLAAWPKSGVEYRAITAADYPEVAAARLLLHPTPSPAAK